MSRRTVLVIVVGAALLALNFTFPYTSYPEKVYDEAGRLLSSTVYHRFMPIWEAREAHARAHLKGNPFDDTIILWHWVFAFAAGIVAVCAWTCLRLRAQARSVSERR